MPVFKRWTLTDPYTGDVYTFPNNPNKMTSPFPEKALTSLTTTAVGGQALVWEGATPPTSWSFGGSILDAAHYEALRSWVYEHQGRLLVTDHFGRGIVCVLRSFKPEPKRAVGRYWRHEYTIEALIFGQPGAPTVGEVPA